MNSLPTRTHIVIIGAGFAGAATAWALGRNALGPGIILEQAATPGEHASGRNAALARVVEPHSTMRAIAMRSVEHIRRMTAGDQRILRPTGSLTLGNACHGPSLESTNDALRKAGIDSELMAAGTSLRRFPFLSTLRFETALWCPADGVVDIHALLTTYLREAKATGFALHTSTGVDRLLLNGSRVTGVAVDNRTIEADIVIDATGAWAGRLLPKSTALTFQPFRRHLYVSGPSPMVKPDWPYVWLLHGEAYFRPEGGGLLMSPCDETPWETGVPPTDPAMASVLAERLSSCAPGLADLTIRRSWACLRTFAPDRRPVIGPDPDLAGLHHVSGLGGAGMTMSAAIGELITDLVHGVRPDWIDPADVAPARFFESSIAIAQAET